MPYMDMSFVGKYGVAFATKRIAVLFLQNKSAL